MATRGSSRPPVFLWSGRRVDRLLSSGVFTVIIFAYLWNNAVYSGGYCKFIRLWVVSQVGERYSHVLFLYFSLQGTSVRSAPISAFVYHQVVDTRRPDALDTLTHPSYSPFAHFNVNVRISTANVRSNPPKRNIIEFCTELG